MIITCPHCNSQLDIGDMQIGERMLHPRCNNWLLIGRRVDGMRYGVKIQPPPKLPFKKVQP